MSHVQRRAFQRWTFRSHGRDYETIQEKQIIRVRVMKKRRRHFYNFVLMNIWRLPTQTNLSMEEGGGRLLPSPPPLQTHLTDVEPNRTDGVPKSKTTSSASIRKHGGVPTAKIYCST